MKNIKKYLLLAFIIENLLAQTRLLGGTSVFFYIFLVAGGYFLFEGSLFKKDTYESCKCLFLLAGVYILYQFTVGFETLSSRTLLYLTAKVTTFIIIVISVSSDWEFYAKRTPQIFSIGVLLVLIYGLLTGQNNEVNGRQLVGFTNTNTTSSMGAFAFAGFLFFRNRQNSLKYLFAMLLCFYAVLAGGSRKGIMILFIIIVMWKGVSIKLVPLIFVLLLFVELIIGNMGIELSGVERGLATLNGEIGTNRDDERLATMMMISERPWTGWGFEAQNVGRAAIVSELGSHNGYLEMLKFMGYPFTILWFLCLFSYILPMIKYYKSDKMEIRYHLTLVIALTVAAMYEGLYVGVHELSTNMFFISLAVLTCYKYQLTCKINKKGDKSNRNNRRF